MLYNEIKDTLAPFTLRRFCRSEPVVLHNGYPRVFFAGLEIDSGGKKGRGIIRRVTLRDIRVTRRVLRVTRRVRPISGQIPRETRRLPGVTHRVVGVTRRVVR